MWICGLRLKFLTPSNQLYIFLSYLREAYIKPDNYRTVSSSAQSELRVKKSVFIGNLSPAENQSEAEEFIRRVSNQYHDAAHNCFAYRIDESLFRTSDAGEPAGTAGKPILAMLDKYELSRIVLVVTRYFGGIKLGTGGLIRAYSECAEKTIQNSDICTRYNFEKITVHYPFELMNRVHHIVHRFGGYMKEEADAFGMKAEIGVLPSRMERFHQELLNGTSGKIEFI